MPSPFGTTGMELRSDLPRALTATGTALRYVAWAFPRERRAISVRCAIMMSSHTVSISRHAPMLGGKIANPFGARTPFVTCRFDGVIDPG
jgi:hypothetical protein